MIQITCYRVCSDVRCYNRGNVPIDRLNDVIRHSYGTFEQCKSIEGKEDWIEKVLVECPETGTVPVPGADVCLPGPLCKAVPITPDTIWYNNYNVEMLEILESYYYA